MRLKEKYDIFKIMTTKQVHFIAIGGSAMHNIAIALHTKGYKVTGSDDEVFEPSRSRLAKHGLLPAEMGWNPERIHAGLDSVIVGMHARPDNPELLKAQELGLTIYSYPEFIYSQSKNKQRIVVAGSHGKTTTTAMIMHVLAYHKRQFDYLVGAQLEGFDTMCKLTEDAPIIVIEGDEYFSSPIDRTPKFLRYQHHIGLVSGIAWDHINVFPTEEIYVRQFDHFADATPKGGILIYNDKDPLGSVICKKERPDVLQVPFQTHPAQIIDGVTHLVTAAGKVPVPFFGQHNLLNVSGAQHLCSKIGITEEMFYEAIQSFKGAANRLELVKQNSITALYKDFAHAPSKVRATTKALKEQYPQRKLFVCLELHTFSSLNKKFLKEYEGALNMADTAIVYFNPEVITHKQLEPITEEEVKTAFKKADLQVYNDSKSLAEMLENYDWTGTNLALMSSGNFDGISANELAEKIVK